MFDEDLREVEYEGTRYILRRNPVRADEMSARRKEKLEYLKELVEKKNQYLKERKRAKPEVAYKELEKKIHKTKMASLVKIKMNNRSIELEIDQEAMQKAGELDGCYAIQTDLPLEAASKETVHQRYKDLALVERDFRTMKTGHLEVRPVFVRKKESTIGHVLVTMLACLIERELRNLWKGLNLTVQEGLDERSFYSRSRIKGWENSVPEAAEGRRYGPQADRSCQSSLSGGPSTDKSKCSHQKKTDF